jgi:hypothetical protein
MKFRDINKFWHVIPACTDQFEHWSNGKTSWPREEEAWSTVVYVIYTFLYVEPYDEV